MAGLIVHTESSLGWGGQEIRVFRELLGMKDFGYDTALIAPQESSLYKRSKEAGIDAYHVAMSSKLNIFSWYSMYRLLKKLNPLVLNTHSSEDSWLAGAVARFLGNSLTIRTRHVSTPIGSMFSYRHFPHLILTTSESIRCNFIKQGVENSNVVTLPTGINFDKYKFSNKARIKVRNSLKLDEGHILIGNVCVLRSWKGLDFFLATVALLPEQFRFLLVGDGPQKEHLQKKAQILGLGDRICFTGHQEKVEEYFSAMDILFYTSYASEGVPQSLLQGVGSGLPVTAVRFASIEETLQGVEKCRWVKYGETEQAANTLKNDAAKLVDQARSQPQKTWRDKHSLTGMLNNINTLYQRKTVHQSY